MDFFYDFEIFKTTKTKSKNSIGQIIESYSISTSFNCDIQPSSSDLVKKTFGEDIVCNYIVFADEELKEADIVVYNDKAFKVKKIIDWIDYKIYAIESVDVNVN